MREVARLSENNRRELFRAAAQAMEVHEAIVEKDFWVCWVLDFLFTDSQWKERLAFKGGTSLSKAYAVIQRFSEDIDLVLDWTLLGYVDEPWQTRSITQQKFSQQANCRTAEFLAQQTIQSGASHQDHLALKTLRQSLIAPFRLPFIVPWASLVWLFHWQYSEPPYLLLVLPRSTA